MKVLVTGGAGFIGSHVVDQLIEGGHSVRILDLTLSPWHPEAETELGSITEPDVVDRAVAGCDAVVHLAAVADVNHVHRGPAGAENVNTRGTANVLDAARRAGVERVVYGSTTWVYSDCPDDEVDEDTAVPPPTHLYTATKLAGELYCKAYAESYGLSVSILRFGIPYGPRAREAAVVPAFVGKALRGEPLTVAGSGEQFRNFVYVVDLAEGIVSALDAPAGVSFYNLAHGDVTTISEIAETVKATVGDVEIVRTPARPGDFGGKRVSSERARAELGWTAGTAFADGVRQYVEWRASNNGTGRAATTKVLILSADIGEGHDLPARVIAQELEAERPGVQATVMDVLDEMGWLPRRLGKDNSRLVFERLPWLFSFQYFLITHQPTRWIAQKLLTLVGGGKLRRLIERHGADLVVATYPGASAVLGELRRRGKLDVPLYSAVTDLAGLWWWAHPGVDMHFVIHPESIPEVEAIAGEGSARWARPPIMPAFHEPRSRAGAREALGLPAEGPIVLVSGGGWGVGDVEGAVETALEQDGVHVVVLCGRSDELRERLARRFGAEPRLRLEGFTERMSDFMAASEALVHTTAGLTVLEAIIRGCTPISYGFSRAHVKVNDRAYEHHGLARTARRRSDLGPELRAALAERRDPDPSFARQRPISSIVLEGRSRVRPLPVWRLRAARVAAVAATFVAASLWTLSNDDVYPVFASVFHWRPVSSVATSRQQVGLLVDAPQGELVAAARSLERRGLRASFEVSGPTVPPAVSQLRLMGDEGVPQLANHSPFRWLKAKGQLERSAHGSELAGHQIFYAAPAKGLTGNQYVLARAADGRAVTPAVHVRAGGSTSTLAAGQIVELVLPADRSTWGEAVDSLSADLNEAGLSAVPVGVLLGGR
jgi:UDP-glucose 4-epimerase